MPTIAVRPKPRAFPVLLALTGGLALAGYTCMDRSRSDEETATRSESDPCTLLTADEALPYVGRLASPPYRASDGSPDVRGDECVYRGLDGREITIRPVWHGATAAGQGLDGARKVVGRAQGLDTLTNRVLEQDATVAGPWDKATWIPIGALMVTKGDAEVSVDVTGASGKKTDAVAIARIAAPRLGKPLQYDGARAVALAPKPRPHPAKACDLVPRGAVEAAIGPLDGAPMADAPETSCRWRVSTPQGERTYAVTFQWEGGSKNFTMLKHQMAMVGGLIGAPSSSPLDTMKLTPGMKGPIGDLMKLALNQPSAGGKHAAPAAATEIGFQTDTTLKGPWDAGALLHGTQLIAVKHDVFVGLDLQSADYAKAKALLAAICTRL